MIDNIKKLAAPLLLFALANLAMGLYAGLYEPSFNNYLAQVHQLDEVTRGSLEFPRELPGFLVVFIFSGLLFLTDTRMGMLATFLVGISLWGQGFFAPNIPMVVVWMLVWSTGSHLFMVLKSSIALRLTDKSQAGTILGRLGGLESLGKLIGMGLVLFGVSQLGFSFGIIFAVSGSCALAAALLLFFIKPQPIKRPPHYLMFKKKYALYYFFNVLFGARKQIFLTFGPWILIRLFNCGIETFAILGLTGTVLGLFFWPLLGRLIDLWGERTIIFIDSIVFGCICIFYGFSPQWFPYHTALKIIMVCYVLDQLFFAVSMVRTTYLNRIAESSDDIAPTLSMGLTIDHAVSMLVPVGGGILWAFWGYQWVFIAAAILALVTLGTSFFIPAPSSKSASANGTGS